MKKFKRIMALVIALAMVLSMGAMTAFAADKTVTVTFNPNGGTLDGSATATATIDESLAFVTVADVTTAIPNVIAPAGKSFDFWGTDAAGTDTSGKATVNDGKATFYAIWKTAPSAVNNLTLDSSVSVKSLEEGDVVDFYRVLQFSQDSSAKATGGWVNAPGFTLSNAEIQKLLGLGDYAAGGSKEDEAGLDAALAAKIADMAENATAAYADVAAASGTATVPVNAGDPVAAGLYMAAITPGQAGTVYNPVFVGVDYKQPTSGTDTNEWTVTLAPTYQPESIAKKSKITVDKKATSQTLNNADNSIDRDATDETKPVVETVNVGDTISFVVETTIPKFANNFTSAVFKVTDALSEGLELVPASVKVYPGWESITSGTDAISGTELPKTFSYDSSTLNAYTVNTDPDNDAETKNGYIVDFTTDYLLKGMGDAAKKITIKYDAVVTTAAPTSINVEENTVTINYSNEPTDTTGKGILKDETKHYTFDIDGNILGQEEAEGGNPWKAAEVVKVGLDKDGNEITQTVALHGSQTEETKKQKIGALEGAEFLLYTDVDCTEQYTNTILTSDKKIVSDGTGRLTISGETTPGIRGLDAGTYYLKETKAPEGYIKEQNPVKIEIIPTITEHNVYEYYDESGTLKGTYAAKDQDSVDDGYIEVHYTYNELDSYVIKINDVQTASYTWVNDKVDKQMPLGDDVVGAGNALITATSEAAAAAGKILNTQGVELPSTGGIGTTIFYVVGAILVIGAGVIMITRRRMDA